MLQEVGLSESELWDCLTGGDGLDCPLGGDYEEKACSSWCIYDYVEKHHRAHFETKLAPGEAVLLLDFFLHRGHCRIFKMVELLATDLLHKCLSRSTCNPPPVPTDIIHHLKISPPVEIRPVPLKAYHGAVWHINDAWIIQVNSNDSTSQQRRTVVHEVWHILARPMVTPVFFERGTNENFVYERLADYFATCFLMPAEMVTRKWQETSDSRLMAGIFDVPERSMWIRLVGLGLILP